MLTDMTADAEFTSSTEPFRRELLAHCYRMLGSAHDAEDIVQETYLRAWRAYAGFEHRASLRTWLYRIATNACLTAVGHRDRRVLPSGLCGPTADPTTQPAVGDPAIGWLTAMPDAMVTPESADPATIVATRASLRLALVASMQHLPARQRSVLILRDVLAFSAAEVAEMLGVSTPAVKSLLQRARARIDEVAPRPDDILEPTTPAARAVVEQYIAAFENADTAVLESVLRKDAALEMVGSPTWFAGRATCLPYLTGQVLGAPGDWRMVPVAANGQPAVAAYRRDEGGVYAAFGIAVLTVTTTGIARIVVYGEPDLLADFDLPPTRTGSR